MLQHSSSCTLSYPDKFLAAAEYFKESPDGLSEETKLLLYALSQQATVGPCTEPKPWGWDVVRNAKWQAWKQLGDLSQPEAWRLFVRTLEEEQPDWWARKSSARSASDSGAQQPAEVAEETAAQEPPVSSAAAPTEPAAQMAAQPKNRSVAEVVVEGSWVSPYISSNKRPPPRYEHAVALVGSQMILIGGSCGGRYLNDTWSLNLEDLTWFQITAPRKGPSSLPPSTNGGAVVGEAEVPPPPPQLPPIAGHATVTWNGNVLCIGGHTKAKDAVPELPVRMLDVKAGVWSTLSVGGEAPGPRGGHTATLVGSRVFVFGGEDARRRSLGDLLVLDLQSMEWSSPKTTGAGPSPRSAHVASVFQGRYLLVFGGGSVAHCFDSLFMLDTETLEWSELQAEGPVPPPRAGHAAALLGSTLYVVGGGNNAAGCADMYSLDLSGLASGSVQWTLVGNTPVESAIASEGLSLVSVPMAGCLVSFGGYNGRYHNSVHVYRPEGYVVVKAPPRAVSPDPVERRSSGLANGVKAQEQQAGQSHPGLEYEKKISELEAARKEAAAAKESVAHEMAIMRRELSSAQRALADSERALAEARGALEGEQGKVVKLEVEVAELRQQLGRMGELEKELEQYRKQALEASQRKGSGIWGYISGQPQ